MNVEVIGSSGQIGSGLLRAFSTPEFQQRSKFEVPKTLIIAAGCSNSSIQSVEIETEFLRFERLLRNIPLRNFSQIVLISSGGSIYGRDFSIPIMENCPTRPTTPYGILKLRCEELVINRVSELGLKLLVLRLANVYSDKLKGIIGSIIRHHRYGNDFELRSRLESTKQYGHLEDYLCVIRDILLESHFWINPNNIVILNVYSPIKYSIQEILSMTESILGSKIEFRIENDLLLPRETIELTTLYPHLDFLIGRHNWTTMNHFISSLR